MVALGSAARGLADFQTSALSGMHLSVLLTSFCLVHLLGTAPHVVTVEQGLPCHSVATPWTDQARRLFVASPLFWLQSCFFGALLGACMGSHSVFYSTLPYTSNHAPFSALIFCVGGVAPNLLVFLGLS